MSQTHWLRIFLPTSVKKKHMIWPNAFTIYYGLLLQDRVLTAKKGSHFKQIR